MSSPSIVQVLTALMSPDNSLRGGAEAFFSSQLETSWEAIVQALVQVLSEASCDVVLRNFAGVLLRRSIEKKGSSIDQGFNLRFRASLIETWVRESNPLLLKRLAHILAQSTLCSPWQELLPTVMSDSRGKPSFVHVAVLNLIEIVADYSPADIQNSFEQIGSFLGTFLSSEDSRVQIACARAIGTCVVSLENEASRSAFRPALQPIINVLGNTLSRGDETDAVSIVENLVKIAQIQPIFFKGLVDQVVGAMLTVAKSEGLEFPTRAIALELMVTLTETAPALARRCPALLEGVIPLAMALTLDMDETEQEWIQGKYSEELADGNNSVGEEAIERIAAGLGGRAVAPVVLTLVQQFAARPEWTHRRGAIAALARLAEGSAQLFGKTYLAQSAQFLSGALADASPVVKYEAIQTLGRFATLFPSDVSTLVTTFVPTLIALMADASACERVRGHAAAAMVNLMNPEVCEAEALRPFLDDLLRALIVALQHSAVAVQSTCLTLLGCVAQVSQESFVPYYASFLPGIKQIISTATRPDVAVLRGKAMECAGLLGEAVGGEVFAPDALEIMTLLAGAMELDRDHDATFDYVLPACARIASALGPRFEPFLAAIMGPVLAGAAQTIQFSMEDVDEEEASGEVARDEATGLDSAVISLGGGVTKRVTLNTHAVQQKTQAARILYELAKSLRGHLKAFLTPSLQALIAASTDRHSADIRSSASLALAKTFEGYIHAVQCGFTAATSLSEVLSACLGRLLECVKGEINGTARACAAEGLRDCLQACFESGAEAVDGSRSGVLCGPDLEIASGITREILQCCGESLTRWQEKEDEFARNEGLEDEDREAFAEELEEEEDLLINLVDVIGQLVKLHGAALMPLIDASVVPSFAPFLAPDKPAALQVVAVCMVDDVIEFGGEAGKKYVEPSLPVFVRNIAAEHSVLRQSSIYGLAQAVRRAPEVCAPHLASIVPALVQFVHSPVAQEEDSEGAKENAIFSLGCIYNSPLLRGVSWGGVDPAAVAALWMQSLPLRTDETEAKVANVQLCDAVERGDAAVIGEGLAHLPHLLRVIAEVLLEATSAHAQAAAQGGPAVTTLAHVNTAQRMQAIARQVFSGAQGGPFSPEIVQRAVGTLSADQQRALQTML